MEKGSSLSGVLQFLKPRPFFTPLGLPNLNLKKKDGTGSSSQTTSCKFAKLVSRGRQNDSN